MSFLVELARLLLWETGMPVPAPSLLAARLLEPLSEPWTVLTGSAMTVGFTQGDVLLPLFRVAWRILRLVLAL